MALFRTVMAIGLLLLGASQANAKAEKRSALAVGQTVEVKGSWNGKTGLFRAKDIELLPQPRRPKLRGPIAAIDTARMSIQLFGRWIRISDETQFLSTGGTAADFTTLRTADRVEVSCKVDSSGAWSARSVRVGKVKASDKVKGTLTWVSSDGRADDTLAISGLRIMVNKKTDIFRTLGDTKRQSQTQGEERQDTAASRP